MSTKYFIKTVYRTAKNVTSDFLSLLVFSNELVPSKNVKNTRSLRSLDVLLHFFGRYSLRLENTLKL